MYKSINVSKRVVEGGTMKDWSTDCFMGKPVVNFPSFKAGGVAEHRLRNQICTGTKQKSTSGRAD